MMVKLQGGPFDGLELTIDGSDWIEIPTSAPPRLDFSVPSVEPFRRETAIYRRSMKSPDVYVFQP